MAVEKVTYQKSMVLKVNEVDNEGNKISRNRTYSNLKLNSDITDVFEVGMALGSLMSAVVEQVQQREYSQLMDIG